MTSARSVDKQTLPKMVVIEWLKAADTTSRDVGPELRCDGSTIGRQLRRSSPGCTPETMEMVQIYIKTK